MTSILIALVALAQIGITLLLYGTKVLTRLPVSGDVGSALLLLPSVAAFALQIVVLNYSDLFRAWRIGLRLAAVTGCAAFLAFVALSVAMLIALNIWGS